MCGTYNACSGSYTVMRSTQCELVIHVFHEVWYGAGNLQSHCTQNAVTATICRRLLAAAGSAEQAAAKNVLPVDACCS